ncbi:two-component sensor histidine kinase [Bermanella marisrubri]|uniref:histidine kinase n=1 Tax=Bermanella marisrubri TaxID=207949 RepID=Q1N034_9GAMM|nr:ATP-binding protein [Bermanella marisrubri]EAT11529.1 PAS/PAC sensor hybrid histidine kinase [Oceanobacter sp. RED65] [Bermanella marisrubri]QIZ85006.1 two-component sensor histidine kinase [Bermanella marisrubri]
MADEYQVAYEREKQARLTAEKMLDEKTREVQSSMDMIQHQFNDLMNQKKEADYLLAVARLTQNELGLSSVIQQYIIATSGYLIVNFARYFFISGGEIKEAQVMVEGITLPQFKADEYRYLFDQEQTFSMTTNEVKCDRFREACDEVGVTRVLYLPIKRFGKVTTVCEFFMDSASNHKSDVLEQCQVASYQIGGMLEKSYNKKKVERTLVEIKRSHDQLKQAQAQLVQSEKMASLGQLSAGVAHEINNPVGFVMSNITTLKEYADVLKSYIDLSQQMVVGVNSPLAKQMIEIDEEQDIEFISGDMQSIINDCVDGLKRIKDIVSNLKSFARADDTEEHRFDLNKTIENTLKVVWNELKYKVTLHQDLDSTLPEILGNEGQISQVIMNMLVNAAQAMETEGEIFIRTKNLGKDVQFEIQDTGSGMSQEVRDKIFDPFFTTKGVNEGTGLGLSITFGIIEKHHGRIECESEEGKGTLFRVRLPIDSQGD